MNDWIRPLIVILCTAVMIYTNLFDGGGSGFTRDSNDPGMYYTYPTLFSPAPFTFAIWLPIFVGCCVLAVYQSLPMQIGNPLIDRFALPYCCALLANASTPFLKIGWSNIVVTFLFACLCFAALVLVQERNRSYSETLFLRIPTMVFTTWCGLAMFVNFCQWLVSRGMLIPPWFAACLVCIAMALGILAILKTYEYSIACVLIWAGIGICYAQPSWNIVATTVTLTSIATIVATAWVFIDRLRSVPIS